MKILQETRRWLIHLLDRFVMWRSLRQARNAANKFNLDFELKCVFDHQLKYESAGHGVVKVPMESGKTGLYKAEITNYLGDTGQKDWEFKFIGYDA